MIPLRLISERYSFTKPGDSKHCALHTGQKCITSVLWPWWLGRLACWQIFNHQITHSYCSNEWSLLPTLRSLCGVHFKTVLSPSEINSVDLLPIDYVYVQSSIIIESLQQCYGPVCRDDPFVFIICIWLYDECISFLCNMSLKKWLLYVLCDQFRFFAICLSICWSSWILYWTHTVHT